MRFVLFLILSSFLFIAPSQGKVGEILGKQLSTNIANNATTELFGYSLNDDYTANINYNHRNSSTTKYRFYHFNNFINTVSFQNPADFFYKEKLFVQPHLYCKRIGLKLVFPEHYFW